MLIEHHIEERDFHEIIEKLMQFRNEVTRRPIGTRGRIAHASDANLITADFCAYGLSPFITTYAQYRG